MPTLKILFVDDEVELCNILSSILEKEEGLDIYTATEPQKAIELAKEIRFDILFLDYHLRRIKGDTLVKDFSGIPHKVLITGDHDLSIEGTDFIDIMRKPFQIEQVFKIINSISETKCAD